MGRFRQGRNSGSGKDVPFSSGLLLLVKIPQQEHEYSTGIKRYVRDWVWLVAEESRTPFRPSKLIENAACCVCELNGSILVFCFGGTIIRVSR